jgi:phosphatidylserine/phosphatidylglycerophosphate/cardiolipin synthase-like enzyme
VDVLGTEAGLAELNLEVLTRNASAPLRIWVPSAAAAAGSRLGFHAKFCLADSEHAYIGSANFTGPGLGSQLEMGILVHGSLAQQVRDVWRLACQSGFVECRNELR